MRPAKQCVLTYETISELTGKSYDAVRQDASSGPGGVRKGFNIEDPVSVLLYVAANSSVHVKTALFKAMIHPSGAEQRRKKR